MPSPIGALVRLLALVLALVQCASVPKATSAVPPGGASGSVAKPKPVVSADDASDRALGPLLWELQDRSVYLFGTIHT
jgi:hypothetical protein